MTQPLGPCHFRTASAVSSAVRGAFLDKTANLDHMGPPFGRETAEKRLDLNIYTGRMMIQKFRQLLPELLGHRLARIDI